MLNDLITNSISYNVKLANIIGIENAIFLSALYYLNTNNNLENEIILDREKISNITGLTNKKQLSILKDLDVLRLIDYNELKDIITDIKTQKIIDLICETDKLITKKRIKTDPEIKQSKRQGVIANLKNHIKEIVVAETDIGKQILNNYIEWVDGVYSNPKGFLSNRAIDVFINKINEYSKGNTSIIMELIEIATINGYRDADWAINVYEQKPKKRGRKPLNQVIQINNTEVF